MYSNDITDNTIMQAISAGFISLSLTFARMQTVLAGTEVYDAELSLQLTEAWKAFEKKGEELLRDQLHKQGVTDEQINARAKQIRRMLGE